MAEWHRVVAADRCPPGQILAVKAGGEDLVIANVDGDFYALKDQCSHADFPLSDGELEGNEVECIYHGARFDVCTGKATRLPAIKPVKSFPVEVRDADLFVEI